MISEKNERDEGSSSCSNTMATSQHIAGSQMQMSQIGGAQTLRVLVAQSTLPHVGELDSAL